MTKPLLGLAPLASALLLTACVSNGSQFESGLRDASLGKPALEDAATPSQNTDVGAAQFDSYRLENAKPYEKPDPATDEGGIWMELERVEANIKTSGNRVTDPKLNAYVKGVVCKVTGPYYGSIRIYIQRIPLFNASMYPNGMMQINSGFLLRARNEAEMVAVIGHEFGHYLRRHGLQGRRDVVAKTNFLAFASLALTAAGAPAGSGDLLSLAAFASLSAYGRDHEREADGYGLRVLYDNGYDVRASAGLWERVAREAKMADVDRAANPIFATHPTDEERLKEQARLADVLAVRAPGAELGRDRYQEQMRAVRASFIEDHVSKMPQKHSHALLDLLIEDGVRIGELYYFKGEIHRRSAEKDGAEEALKLYDKSIQNEGMPPQAHKGRAIVLLALGRRNEARESFETYVKLAPTALDTELVRAQIEELKQ